MVGDNSKRYDVLVRLGVGVGKEFCNRSCSQELASPTSLVRVQLVE